VADRLPAQSVADIVKAYAERRRPGAAFSSALQRCQFDLGVDIIMGRRVGIQYEHGMRNAGGHREQFGSAPRTQSRVAVAIFPSAEPRTFAVARLIVSSNFVGRLTGSSSGWPDHHPLTPVLLWRERGGGLSFYTTTRRTAAGT
jgi:hypothetical protein